MKFEKLLLLSGNDIPFPGAQVTIHAPTLKEIAFIGEENFFVGAGFLNFSKDLLSTADKNNLENYNNFDIFMSIVINKDPRSIKAIEAAFLVLDLIFPLYQISVRDNVIVLKREEKEFFIKGSNFEEFKTILVDMFNLNLGKSPNEEYNPVGDMSARIAEKFKQRHEKLSKIKQEQNNGKQISILSNYISILSVGLQLSLTDIMNWTVYQLYDVFQRFQLKMQWDANIQARVAGATNLEEVDNWMIDLQDQGKNKNKK